MCIRDRPRADPPQPSGQLGQQQAQQQESRPPLPHSSSQQRETHQARPTYSKLPRSSGDPQVIEILEQISDSYAHSYEEVSHRDYHDKNKSELTKLFSSDIMKLTENFNMITFNKWQTQVELHIRDVLGAEWLKYPSTIVLKRISSALGGRLWT